jgi:hypothetical protein
MNMIEQLKWIIQAMAQPYDIQKQMFPEFVNVADELALEWEAVLDELHLFQDVPLLSGQQKISIKSIDEFILSISGSGNAQYWNNDALCNSAEWEKIRTMASNFLIEMGWEKIAPAERYDRVYVGE